MNKLFVMMMVAVCCVLGGTHYAAAEGEDGWVDPLPVCAMGERTTWMGCYPYPDDMFTGMVVDPECGTDAVGVLGCAYDRLQETTLAYGLPVPHGVAYVPTGTPVVGEYWCDHDTNKIFFCASAEMMFVGQAMYDQYYDYSHTLPYVALAHEYGHFLQQVMGVPWPTLASTMIYVELQADCIAGFLLGLYVQQGAMADDEMSAVRDLYLQWGSDDHGSGEQRSDSFFQGYDTLDLSSCDLNNINV